MGVNNMTYIPTIGIEVHVELNTQNKAFSPTINKYGDAANTLVNEIDLGLPGTLPTLNKEMIHFGIKAAMALNCKINQKMYFERKNYFYPDNSKNFQITQGKTPIGYDGYITVEVDNQLVKVEIERIHLEEDTAKSIHEQDKTYLDFNRAGVPLIEIVTKPMITNSEMAIKYLEKLKEILLYLGVSDVKIEEGSMRCDANISVSKNDKLGIKTEVKNIGSIKNVGLAIDYEIERQINLLNNNEVLVEETRRFNDSNNQTIRMRIKETGNDYRYFPEPDIPYVNISDEWLSEIKATLPMLPDDIRLELANKQVNNNNIEALIGDIDALYFYLAIKNRIINPVSAINLIITDLKAYSNNLNKKIINLLQLEDFIEIANDLANEVYSKQMVKRLLEEIIINKLDITDAKAMVNQKESFNIEEIVVNILNNNFEAINDYKAGKDRALKYLMGQVMKETKGVADAVEVQKVMLDKLSKL